MPLSSHHAYVCYDAPVRVRELALMLTHELDISVAHNPDLHIREYQSLGIDEARKLSELASMSGTGGRKLFVIAAEAITREAQNALLKTIEEPAGETFFGLLVPPGSLIATLRSRLVVLGLPQNTHDTKLAKEFLSALPSARSKLVGKLVEDKEKHSARALLDGVELLLREKVEKKEIREALSEVSEMRGYLMGPSPSVKMIFEHLALSLPVLK